MYRRPLLLLLILASVVLLVIRLQHDSPIERAEPQLFKDKLYLETFTARGFNEDGQLDRLVKGQRLSQPVDTQDSYVTLPDVTLLEGKREKWNLTAASAWMNRDHSQARLEENLKLREQTSAGLTLDSSRVDVDLIKHQLRTNENVIIKQPNGTTRGKGLAADLNSSRFELKSNVESVYEQ